MICIECIGFFVMVCISSPLVFFRHGATSWNLERRYQGKTDTDLSDLGREQCATNAALLNSLQHTGIIDFSYVRFVVSPLQRASQSVRIISEICGLSSSSFEVHPSFSELGMGRWEGLTSEEVKSRYYEERQSRKLSRWTFCPTGGESLSDRLGETQRALQELSAHTIIVTHAGIIRIIQHYLGGWDREKAASFEMPHIGALIWDTKRTYIYDTPSESSKLGEV